MADGPLFGDKARIEIERKFLVTGEDWRGKGESVAVRQGFLSLAESCTVRVRSVLGSGYLTVKGPTRGMSREEFEYEIPHVDAERLLSGFIVGSEIRKVRHRIPFGGLVWEVDEFEGENRGLLVAEVELESEDQAFTRPDWVGEEVTGDPRYFNAYLARHPYRTWPRD